MGRRLADAARFVCAAWVLPAGFSLVAFFGFFTNYTTDVFSPEGLAAQYGRSVFRYRVLGPYLVTTVSSWLESTGVALATPRAMAVLDPAGAAATYWAYALVHIAGTCIGCSLLLAALRRDAPGRGDASALVVAAVSMLLALAAFVVTPYDGVFFAFQMAALAITVSLPLASGVVPLAAITVGAALTRETAYFIPAFYLAVHHRAVIAGDRSARAAFALSGAAAVATYAGLRAALGFSGGSSVYYAWQWSDNVKWTSLTGSAMFAASLVLLMSDGPNRQARRWYAALAVPYIVFVHVFAEPWEWRLWVPVLVPLVALRVMGDFEGRRR